MTAPARRTPCRSDAAASFTSEAGARADAIVATLPPADLNALSAALARLLLSAAKNGFKPRRGVSKKPPTKKRAARG